MFWRCCARSLRCDCRNVRVGICGLHYCWAYLLTANRGPRFSCRYSGWRPPGRRWLSVSVGVLSVAVAWSPFYIADPSSLSAVSFKITVADASVIHLFGIVGGTPAWSRPAQLLTGAALASVAIYRGRWPAVGLARHVGSNCETVMGSLMTQTRTCEPVHWPQASEMRTPLMSEASSVKSSTTVRARSWTSVKPANVLSG